MKGFFKYKRIYLLALAPLSLLLVVLAKENSHFTEQIYSKVVYRFLAQIISTIIGLFPLSLAELLVLILPALILVLVSRFIIKLIMNKGERKELIAKGLLNILCTGSILWFSFTLLGGLNYYRYSFASYSQLEVVESSIEELYALTESLALQANELRAQVPLTDEEGVFQLSMSNRALSKAANVAYKELAKDYPILRGIYGAPKPILLSKLMSKTEITGIFVPFTMEANVNVDVPDYTIPATMLHELAHLRGFMREDEANFLAYMAGMKSDNVEIRYSSTMLALVISGNALYDQSPDMYFQIRELYNQGVLNDIYANSSYWQQYEDTAIATMSNRINDSYLKANAQADGVKSYGRMLDLLLAKFREENKDLHEKATLIELHQ